MTRSIVKMTFSLCVVLALSVAANGQDARQRAGSAGAAAERSAPRATGKYPPSPWPFARGNPSKTGIGINYLKACLNAARCADEQARLFAQGLCSVMDGERDTFELDSLCLIDGDMRVFRGKVERLIAPTRSYYMVSHEDLNALAERAKG